MSANGKKPNLIVGTLSRGEGNTLAAQVIGLAGLARSYSLQPVAVDRPPGSARRSELRRVLPYTLDMPISAPFSEIAASGSAAVAHFDSLGEVFARGGALVDVGSNVLPGIFNWLKQTDGMGDLGIEPLWLIVPMTSRAAAVEEAVGVFISSMNLPIERRILLVNQRYGGLEASPCVDRLTVFRNGGLIEETRFLKCESKLLPLAEAKSLSLFSALSMNVDQAQQEFRLGKQEAFNELEKLRKWFWAQSAIFVSAGLFP